MELRAPARIGFAPGAGDIRRAVHRQMNPAFLKAAERKSPTGAAGSRQPAVAGAQLRRPRGVISGSGISSLMSGMKPGRSRTRGFATPAMLRGSTQRETARRFGIDPKTVRKMLTFAVPPGDPAFQPTPPAPSSIRSHRSSIAFWRRTAPRRPSSATRPSGSMSAYGTSTPMWAATPS